MRFSTITLIILCAAASIITIPGLYGEDKTINTQFTVRDSLSQEAIPMVRITVETFKQTLVTRRSAFYLPLKPGTYGFVLESDGYETLKRTVVVSAQSYAFLLEMVSNADRQKIKENDSILYHNRNIFEKALRDGDIVLAEMYLSVVKTYARNRNEVYDSLRTMLENAKKSWTDSLFRLARENEESKKFTEARYYYNRLFMYDSLLAEARAGIRRVDSLAAAANRPKEVKKMTPEEIEIIFQEGRAQFTADDYVAAKKLFQRVLANDPAHEKAKDYLRRTEARLKALGR
jgi:tetratricopeptide (TPR) repeat protein